MGGSELHGEKPEWPLEMTPRQSLTRLNFWLLFFVFGMGSACGLLFLNNAGLLFLLGAETYWAVHSAQAFARFACIAVVPRDISAKV